MSREIKGSDEASLDPSEFPEEQANLIRRQIRGVPVLRPTAETRLEDFVVALQWSPDGQCIAAGLGSGQVSLMKAERLKQARSWRAHSSALAALDWSPEGDRIATGGQDVGRGTSGKFRVWDVSKMGEEQDVRPVSEGDGGAYSVDLVEYAPGGAAIVTASGKHLKVWERDCALIQAFEALPSTISGVKWRGSHERLATSSYGGIHFWEVGLSSPKRHFGWKGSLISLEISPSGKWIAAGCQEQSVHIWKAVSGEDLEMSGYPTKVRAIRWSPDGRYLVTGGGADITVWDFSGKGPAGSRPRVMPGHVDVLVAFAFRPGFDSQFASIGKDGAFFLWDLNSGGKPIRLGIRLEAASSLAWSPDGTRLAIGYETGDVCLWNMD
jgi:WD40 repeat protein